MKIRFLGALGSVTGSCSLLNHRNRYYLVDCGSAQSADTVNAASGSMLPFKAGGIRAVFLTHAHFDHCGRLPILVKEGFRGKIYCTRATADLTRHALMDVAALGTGGFSASDVAKLTFVCPDEDARFQFGTFFPVDRNLTCAFIRTSHVLGAVGFEFQFSDWREQSSDRRRTIVFSGDIGCNTDANPYQVLLNGRQYPSTHAEYIVCESTYGDRDREPSYKDFWARMNALKALVARAVTRGPGATVVFPCFALQRAQELIVDLHCVLDLMITSDERRGWATRQDCAATRIAEILVDSPLAAKYGEVFARELKRTRANGKPFYRNTALISRLGGSEADLDAKLAALLRPENGKTEGRNYTLSYGCQSNDKDAAVRIVIAGAGMCNGGRVTEHLKKLLKSHKTVVALTGYQSGGTPGAELMRRANDPSYQMDASFWGLSSDQVKAEIVSVSAYYSGHADRPDLIDFLMRRNCPRPHQDVKRVFLIHGEDHARAALRQAIKTRGVEKRMDDRVIEGIELPEPFSGWFDLLRNEWVSEFHPAVDCADMEICALRAELKRRDEEDRRFTMFARSQMAGFLRSALPTADQELCGVSHPT